MAKPLEVDQQWLERIAEQVSGLHYGHVTITVHDGRIVQIDRLERTRYDQPSSKQNQSEQQPNKGRESAATGDGLRIVQ